VRRLSSRVRCDSLGLARLERDHEMGWTQATRRPILPRGQRDANALTDKEWELIEPFMPGAKATGRPRPTDLRAVVDALLYVRWTGCRWRASPDRFPPVRRFNSICRPRGTTGRGGTITFHLVTAARLALVARRARVPASSAANRQSPRTCRFAWLRRWQETERPQAPYHYDTQAHLDGPPAAAHAGSTGSCRGPEKSGVRHWRPSKSKARRALQARRR